LALLPGNIYSTGRILSKIQTLEQTELQNVFLEICLLALDGGKGCRLLELEEFMQLNT
jgi:hypothetical protein